MANGKFGTSISCMDGRIQIPINNWIKKIHSVDYVDTITEPGVEKKISESIDIDKIKSKAEISIFKHNSGLVVVSGHHDCAGNPVPREQQIEHTRRAAERLRTRFPDVEVVAVWVDENWQVQVLAD